MNVNTKRRFIAGAVCPRCGQMDTIFIYREGGVDHRECVSCDFAEKANFSQMAEEELPTRVNRPVREAVETVREQDLQVVKILDPEKKK
jgi:uncharacterized protein